MIRRDLRLHFLVSFVLALAGAFLFGPKLGFVLALMIGAFKEVVWDGVMRRGKPEWVDMVANLIGIGVAIALWVVWLGKG